MSWRMSMIKVCSREEIILYERRPEEENVQDNQQGGEERGPREMKWVWVMSQYFQSFKIPVKVTEICYTTRRKLKREKQINCREWGPQMMDLFISLKGAKWFVNFHMWVDKDLSWGGSNEERDADMGDWGREHLWTQRIDVRVEAEGRVTKPSSLLDRGMDCLAL